MYVDTDDYEALNARICQVLQQLQDASCLAVAAEGRSWQSCMSFLPIVTIV